MLLNKYIVFQSGGSEWQNQCNWQDIFYWIPSDLSTNSADIQSL